MKNHVSTSYRAARSRGALMGILAVLGLVAATSAGCAPESATASSASSTSGGGGGGESAESACHVSMNVTLPPSPLTTDFSTQLHRAGADFLLTSALGDGNSEGGSTFSWARSTRAGVLGPQVDPSGAPAQYFYGLTPIGKATAADQLVAISRGMIDPVTGEELLAAVMDETTRIAGATHAVLNAHNAGQTIRTAVASSLDGRRAVFVDGNVALQDPLVIVLGGDGVRQGAPVSVTTTTDHLWDCLSVVPTVTAGAVSTVEKHDEKSFWHLVEVDAKGAQVFESSVDLTDLGGSFSGGGCPRIALTKDGFTGRFVDGQGAMVLLTVDRATFATAGATRIQPSNALTPTAFFASVGDGFAFLSGDPDGTAMTVSLIDKSGKPTGSDLHITMAPGVARSLIPSAPGTLLVSTRDDGGPLGWLEVTCDAP